MSSIKPPTGWNLILDDYENTGEVTLEKKNEGIKIHCNDKGDSYLLTAIHMLNGFLEEKNIEYTSDINEELDDFAETIESEYI